MSPLRCWQTCSNAPWARRASPPDFWLMMTRPGYCGVIATSWTKMYFVFLFSPANKVNFTFFSRWKGVTAFQLNASPKVNNFQHFQLFPQFPTFSHWCSSLCGARPWREVLVHNLSHNLYPYSTFWLSSKTVRKSMKTTFKWEGHYCTDQHQVMFLLFLKFVIIIDNQLFTPIKMGEPWHCDVCVYSTGVPWIKVADWNICCESEE